MFRAKRGGKFGKQFKMVKVLVKILASSNQIKIVKVLVGWKPNPHPTLYAAYGSSRTRPDRDFLFYFRLVYGIQVLKPVGFRYVVSDH